MSDQGDSVTAGTLTHGTREGLGVGQNLIEDLVVMRKNVILQITVVFTDLPALETLRSSLVIVSLHCSLRREAPPCQS